MFIYDRFKALAKQRGMTQLYIAQKLEKHPSVFRDWSRLQSDPPEAEIRVVAECLNCVPGYLIGQTEKPTAPDGEQSALTEPQKAKAEILEMLDGIPDEKLEKFKAVVQAAIDAVK